MGALQPWHLIVILVIVLVVLGPGRLPELGKSLGEGMRELKKATQDPDPSAKAKVDAPAASVAAAPVARQCPQCRGTVGAADRFCGSCGTSLTASPAAPTAS